ncbi:MULTISPECIES: potassium/proton antiporter [Gammaproteobacteria]|uniref:potassium/proton antiporter n=1 Tax=Gammaproteobacteria TaxID=1236 RepID=UPI000DCFF33B|nr:MULTISPECIES: potassium/proton antiporter [Gammaproteobacteria]RTE87713.1 potassium/proton antiporter [Aliidiomarina sp. B3213]TCZ92504.1 potassium/proton antiporter [Lysobacter sp. N42]
MDAVNLTILIAGGLLFVSIVATQVSVRSGAPLLLVFLVLGMLAGEDGILGLSFNNPDIALLIGSVALVIILFDGGLRTHPERFRVALAPAAALASVGVVITCLITGLTAAWLFNVGWVEGLLLGAILSSTDAAAVFSIFQTQGLKIKDRVASTLEIESGSNDPMAVMLTVVLVGVLANSEQKLDASVIFTFVQQAIVGAAVGYIGGRVFVKICKALKLHVAFFPLLAVGGSILVYGLTAQLGGSGFLAVYLMGYLVGNARLPQVINILRVHDGLAWLSQIVMFLMLGLLMTPSKLIDIALPALSLAAILIFVARPIAVFVSLLPFKFPWRDRFFISWVGLRGAVPIVLALFPWIAGLENQERYFEIAFFVVLVSLMLQGWTITPFARKLGLEVPPDPAPNVRFPVDQIASDDMLELAAFHIDEDTPACDHHWNEISIAEPVEFAGLIRNGEWLRAMSNPVLSAGDTLLVLARTKDIGKISDVLAANGSGERLTKKTFFGDFVLNADITLQDLAGFYVWPEGLEIPEDTIAQLFEQKFRRRVVVGDHIVLGNLIFTAREVEADGTIIKVGMKSVGV